uniref:RRP15-like protein n=1 Tax=Globodera rostochiensis TaxID=31243 RepID=A0A914ID69_GLORO
MGDFREKQTPTNGQNGSDVSDDEEQMHKRILDGRPKAVPKRITMLSNGGASTSASSAAGHPDDEMSESLGEDFPKKASLCAGQLWTDTVLMQSLEDKMGGTAGKGTTIVELRDRGAETYALKKVNKNALKKKVGGKRRRSEDIAEAMFDDDGSSGGQIDDTKDNKSDVLKEMGKESKEGVDDADEALSVAVDSAVSLWEGVDTGSAEPPLEQRT